MPKKTRKTGEQKKSRRTLSIELPLDVPRDLYERFVRDIEKGAFKVLTPYTLAKEYDTKISLARKILRIAAKQGVVKLYSGGRTPIFVAS